MKLLPDLKRKRTPRDTSGGDKEIDKGPCGGSSTTRPTLLLLAVVLTAAQLLRVLSGVNGNGAGAFASMEAAKKMAVTQLYSLSMYAMSNISTVSSRNSNSNNHNSSRGGRSSTPIPRRFAILLSFVPSKMWEHQPLLRSMEAIINKACYARLWNYDFFIRTTDEFKGQYTANITSPDQNATRPWLQFGAWNRVPHLQTLMDSNKYDWIMYGDDDLLIRDMSTPLESLLQEIQLFGRYQSVSAILPTDFIEHDQLCFSSFAILLKNSPFGREILERWREFGMGLCAKGNYKSNDITQYSWVDSDQPGLWYALAKAHQARYYPNEEPLNWFRCNNETGYLAEGANGFTMSNYFRERGYIKGHSGPDLASVPADQALLWSSHRASKDAANETTIFTNGGFAINTMVGGSYADKMPALKHAFAIHTREPMARWDEIFGDSMTTQMEQCKKNLGCYANYTEDGVLSVGCDGIVYYSGKPGSH